MRYIFKSRGLKLTDPRIYEVFDYFNKLEEEKRDLDFDSFRHLIKPRYSLLHKMIQNQVVVEDCDEFISNVEHIFNQLNGYDYGGFIPDYIPQLK